MSSPEGTWNSSLLRARFPEGRSRLEFKFEARGNGSTHVFFKIEGGGRVVVQKADVVRHPFLKDSSNATSRPFCTIQGPFYGGVFSSKFEEYVHLFRSSYYFLIFFSVENIMLIL